MKMYYITVETINPIPICPEIQQQYGQIIVELLTKDYYNGVSILIPNCNGNYEYRLSHANKEYLISAAKYYGCQDAEELVVEVDSGDKGSPFIMPK